METPECCSCHINPPCSYCLSHNPDEPLAETDDDSIRHARTPAEQVVVAAMSSPPPTAYVKPVRTPEQAKIEAAFEVRRDRSSYACVYYTVTRKDPSVPWLSDAQMLKLCDDGWDSFFRSPKSVSHFGGRITHGTSACVVCVYID